MSLWSKVKKGITEGAKILPALAAAVPSSKGLASAAQAFQTGAAIAQMKSPVAIPGTAGPISYKQPAGALPVSMQAGSLPAFPAMPGGTGGFVKTGLPVVAAGAAVVRAAAPYVARAAAATLPFIKKNAAKALNWAVVGDLVYDLAGNLQGRTTSHRRINPLNAKAARRAIRRIKAVRKIASTIERALPKARHRR